MTTHHRLTRSGWALIVVGAVALTLGGCGRKGPLERPTASSAQTPVAPPQGDTEAQHAAQPSLFNPSYGANAPPAAPRGRADRSFVLDPLLGN